MTTHMTGTRQEWLAARLGLLEAEKEPMGKDTNMDHMHMQNGG